MEDQKTLDLRSFKKWLRENKNTLVGWVGYSARVTPLLQYCTTNNVSLTSKVKSVWGAKYDEYCKQYEGVPGRYTGEEALTLLCQVIGYQHYFN